jgi:hypothetical protein
MSHRHVAKTKRRSKMTEHVQDSPFNTVGFAMIKGMPYVIKQYAKDLYRIEDGSETLYSASSVNEMENLLQTDDVTHGFG